MSERTETLDKKIEVVVPPLPEAAAEAATVPLRQVRRAPLVLRDSGGRYVLSVYNYEEFGRQHFLDLEGSSYISKRHFALKWDGKLYIRDLGSRNGTFVNGRDIRGAGWVELKEGDVVNIANIIELKVEKAS